MISQRTINKIAIVILVVITLLEFVLKLGGNKGLYRYPFMWLTIYGRFLFGIKLYSGYAKHIIMYEALGFGMSLVLFLNLNSSRIEFNIINIIVVIILEAILFAMYKYESTVIYEVEREEFDR